MSSIAVAGTVGLLLSYYKDTDSGASNSIGMSLIDTLDDLVHSGRIEPQTAMKVIATFDKSITEVLADKVKARMNFKVSSSACLPFSRRENWWG